jgi:outer membrane autotransporter protein
MLHIQLRRAIACIMLSCIGTSLCANQLDELNAELARIGLPLAGSADLNAVLLSKDYLTFIVNRPDSTQAQYTITDASSLNRVFNAMKANDGFDSISSRIDGATLIRTAPFSNNGVCAGPSGEHAVSTWAGALECLGLTQAFDSAAALSTLAATETVDFTLNRPTTEVGNMLRLVRGLRASAGSKGASGLSTGGSAGSDQYHLYGNLGVYLTAGGSFGKLDERRGYTGYDSDQGTISAGLDYRLSDRVSAGVILSYVDSSLHLSRGMGNSSSDVFRIAPYATIAPLPDAYIDVSAGYGYRQASVNRRCSGCADLLHGDYRSHEGFGSINLGYSRSMGALSATGYGRADVIGIVSNGYDESGSDATSQGVRVGSNRAVSVTTTLGAEVSYAWSTPHGVVVPRLFGEWVHEYQNDSRAITGTLQSGAIPFVIQTASPIRDWGNLGAGVQMVLPNSLALYANYEGLVMRGAKNHTLGVGVRWEL